MRHMSGDLVRCDCGEESCLVCEAVDGFIAHEPPSLLPARDVVRNYAFDLLDDNPNPNPEIWQYDLESWLGENFAEILLRTGRRATCH
jgi:hypothetical protein